MNPLVLFFIFGAATATNIVTYEGRTLGGIVPSGPYMVNGLEKEGLQFTNVEVPVVGQVGVQNDGFISGRTSQFGSGVTGRTEIPVVGQVSEGVVGTQTQYPVGKTILETFGPTTVQQGNIIPSGIVPTSEVRSGVEYPVFRSGYNTLFKAFPYLQHDYPVETYPIVQSVQYPFLDDHLGQNVHRNAQLLKGFPYLYNREYPVEIKTGQYPIGEKLAQVQTPYLKNVRQGYNREYTGVRDAQVSETVAPVFRDVPLGKYERVNKIYGQQYNPIYRAFPHLYTQEYPTQFHKTYTYGKFPVAHSYKPIYGQDYFNTRFLDQDVFDRHVQEYPVYKHEFPVYKHEYPVYKHEYPVYKHEYPVYKHEYPVYKHEYPVYKHEYPVYKHQYPVYETKYINEKYPVYKHEYPVYENKKYPQFVEPIEQREELPLNYEVPFRTGYPVGETLDEKLASFY